MKKRMEEQPKRVVPAFATGTEEAEWWYKNRDIHGKQLRIPEADLALARKQAEQKGLPYQTHIKSLLHETLTEREKRKVG
jgi:predicted DNA binding CopG/RHH family protein